MSGDNFFLKSLVGKYLTKCDLIKLLYQIIENCSAKIPKK